MDLTPELIQRIVERLFAPNERPDVMAVLDRYDDAEPLRVRVALLKLSDGELKKLRHFVERALQDYRDVLAWAEYPEQLMQPTWSMPPEDVRRITTADRDQYDAWLRQFGET